MKKMMTFKKTDRHTFQIFIWLKKTAATEARFFALASIRSKVLSSALLPHRLLPKWGYLSQTISKKVRSLNFAHLDLGLEKLLYKKLNHYYF